MDIKNAIDFLNDVITEGFPADGTTFSVTGKEKEALETALSALEKEQFYSIMGITGQKAKIMYDTVRERVRQDEKWGVQNHRADTWATIIGEEYGEMCKAVNEFGFNPTPETEQDIYTEAIQTMASCMAMLECMEAAKAQRSQ